LENCEERRSGLASWVLWIDRKVHRIAIPGVWLIEALELAAAGRSFASKIKSIIEG
jgi:hypothetical protein